MARGDISVNVKPKSSWQKDDCLFPSCKQPSTLQAAAEIEGAEDYSAAIRCCDRHIDYAKEQARADAMDEARFRGFPDPQPRNHASRQQEASR